MNYSLHDYNAFAAGQTDVTLDVSSYSYDEITMLWNALAALTCKTKKLTLYSLKSPGSILPSASSSPTLKSTSTSLQQPQRLALPPPPDWDQDEEPLPLLSQVLFHNSTLCYLDLSSNLLTRGFVQDLADALAANHTLTSLDLGYNLLGDCGARTIATMLKHNIRLKVLILVGNQITDCGAQHLLGALKHNASLQALYLVGNRVSPHVLELVDSALIHIQHKAGALALRSAQQVRRLSGPRTAIKRLPPELVRLVLGML